VEKNLNRIIRICTNNKMHRKISFKKNKKYEIKWRDINNYTNVILNKFLGTVWKYDV
jgi:hypothetical protein